MTACTPGLCLGCRVLLQLCPAVAQRWYSNQDLIPQLGQLLGPLELPKLLESAAAAVATTSGSQAAAEPPGQPPAVQGLPLLQRRQPKLPGLVSAQKLLRI